MHPLCPLFHVALRSLCQEKFSVCHASVLNDGGSMLGRIVKLAYKIETFMHGDCLGRASTLVAANTTETTATCEEPSILFRWVGLCQLINLN